MLWQDLIWLKNFWEFDWLEHNQDDDISAVIKMTTLSLDNSSATHSDLLSHSQRDKSSVAISSTSWYNTVKASAIFTTMWNNFEGNEPIVAPQYDIYCKHWKLLDEKWKLTATYERNDTANKIHISENMTQSLLTFVCWSY